MNLFKPLVLIGTLYSAFVSGSEDVGKFVKPLIAVVNLDNASNTLPNNIIFWILTIFNLSICSGILGLISRYVKAKLTQLNPIENFSI
mmetsp:Transcript_13201/g.1181  ORF Transcript_13201/g.1181 Transcript_13201/m.1181 type:complete len:88 (+) Transcript_13201:70-333(+)